MCGCAKACTACDSAPIKSRRVAPARSTPKAFTAAQARTIGERLGLRWNRSGVTGTNYSPPRFKPRDLQRGMNVELEHRDVTHGDPIATAKIALAHLREFPDYYEQLEQILRCDRDELSSPRARDPEATKPPVVGAIYHLEWDVANEGGVGTYRYLGIYPQTDAMMFQRLSRTPRERETLYLFENEIRHLTKVSRGKPAHEKAPDSSARPRASSRVTAPTLRPGRVLGRGVRQSSSTWEDGIVGPGLARAARFVGFRRIALSQRGEPVLFAVWEEGHMLYAQPWRNSHGS